MRRLITCALGAAALAVPASAQATFPGTDGRLTFFQDDVGAVAPYGITRANANGSGQRLIGPTCQEGASRPCPRHPSWSSAGDRIAFELAGDVATMRPSGNQVRILPVAPFAHRPAFSPSGAQIVFEGVAGGRRNLYVVGSDGTGLRRLTGRGGAQPAWSFNNRIAFIRRGRLYVMNADGSSLRRLTGRSARQPDWSGFAGQIAFVRRNRLYRLRLSDGKAFKLTGRNATEPAWAPSGQSILFQRFDGANYLIYRLRPDGTGLSLVTGGDEGRRFAAREPNQRSGL